MASVAAQLIEEVTAHEQSYSLEDAREICADGTYFPNTLRNNLEILIGKSSRWNGEWMKESTSKWHSNGIKYKYLSVYCIAFILNLRTKKCLSGMSRTHT